MDNGKRESGLRASPPASRRVGWKAGIAGWCAVVAVVLATNVILAIYVGARFGYTDGLGTLYEGDCDRITAYNTGAHVLINLLGILLLSGSNYCMQCLTAPSRREVDDAHRQGRTLEIGIASFRNLWHVARWKVVMWILFALSSIPLHLLYNTVVYGSLSSNSYIAFAVNEAFISTENVTAALAHAGVSPLQDETATVTSIATTMRDLAQAGKLDKLNNQDCIDAYATTFLAQRQNLLLVVNGPAANNDATVYHYNYDDANYVDMELGCALDPVPWMCAEQNCNVPCLDRVKSLDAATWAPFSQPVQYCLSQRVDEQCQLQFSLSLAVVVICFNVVKLALMLIMLLGRQEARLHTIGDAIQSFLQVPDPKIVACMHSAKEYKKGSFAAPPQPWKAVRTKFSSAAGKHRWRLSFVFYSLATAVCIGLLGYGLNVTTGEAGPGHLLSLGIGTVTAETYIFSLIPTAGISGFMANVFLANLPQLILSCAYFTYNGLFTSMLAAYEWSQWAWKKRALRVSQNPQGAQQSSYFLHLPYRYAIPLLSMSAVMHWLVSQSLFMVTVTRFGIDGQPKGDSLCWNSQDSCSYEPTRYSCGWSPIAVVCVIVGGIGMMVAATVIGWGFHLKPGMPLGGTCSAVIAAACHTAEEGPVELQELKWGVVQSPTGLVTGGAGDASSKRVVHISTVASSPLSSASDEASYFPVSLVEGIDVAHCAFSTGNPGYPQEGVLYR